MVPGIAIPHEMRELIFDMHIARGIPANDIYKILFHGDLVHLKYFQSLCRKLQVPEFARYYRLGPHISPGRPRQTSRHESMIIGMLGRQTKVFCCNRLRQTHLQDYFGPARAPNIGCSESTFLRLLHRHGLTRKIKSTRHIHCDHVEGLQFLQRISHLDPMYCIDIDETACSRESFLEKYGWAQEGDRCIFQQIVINDRSYSVLAAVTPIGFLCWEIFEGGVGHEQFVTFLNQRMLPFVTAQHFCVIDNASIHRHYDSRVALQHVFNGNYFYSARYSPHLKPIETCFAMIKKSHPTA